MGFYGFLLPSVTFAIQEVEIVSEHWTTNVKDIGDTEEPIRCPD